MTDTAFKNRHSWRAEFGAALCAIKVRRTKLGMTQEDLAGKAGMALRTYQRFETGKRSVSALEFFALAAAVGLEVSVTPRGA